jgi:hypothetical protein
MRPNSSEWLLAREVPRRMNGSNARTPEEGGGTSLRKRRCLASIFPEKEDDDGDGKA